MRKHILISSGSLKIGGVERLLIEYLNNIDKKRFKITLILMSDFGEKAILKNELNNDINVKYLKSSDIIEKKASLYKKKKNFIELIFANIMLQIFKNQLIFLNDQGVHISTFSVEGHGPRLKIKICKMK